LHVADVNSGLLMHDLWFNLKAPILIYGNVDFNDKFISLVNRLEIRKIQTGIWMRYWFSCQEFVSIEQI